MGAGPGRGALSPPPSGQRGPAAQVGGQRHYGTDSRPPPGVLIVNAFQHASLIMLSLISSAVVLAEAGLDRDEIRNQLGLILVGVAIMNILVSVRIGPFGAGVLLPVNVSAVFLVPAMLAAREGGLPLISGMIIYSGVLMMVFAQLLPRLRPFFPAEIAGLVILIIGLDISMIGLTYVMTGGAETSHLSGGAFAVSVVTLGAFIAVSVWIGGTLSNYSVLLAIFTGFVALIGLDMLGLAELAVEVAAPLVAVPVPRGFGLAFDPSLALVYAVTTLGVTLHLLGNITNAQQMSDPAWVRPNMRSLFGGTLGAGLGLIVMGFFGGHGAAANSASLGLTKATGVLSLRVVYAIALLLCVGALSPVLVDVVLAIPAPITGAVWLALGAYVIIGGIGIMTSRVLDVRKSLIIGLSMPIGLSAKVYPEVYATLPTILQPLTGSTLVLGTVSAVLLNAIFRIGVSQSAVLTLQPSDNGRDRIESFMRQQGGLWAARVSVVDKVTFSLVQLHELIRDHRPDADGVVIRVEFDEYNLRVAVSHGGAPLDFPTRRPSPREIVTREDGTERLAGYLVRKSADGIEVAEEAGRSTVNIRFEH